MTLITLRSLRKEYGDVIAVNNVDLEIPKGTIFGLIGPNGAGKTTTLRMITGLLEPTSGSVSIDGIDVWKDPLNAFAKIGYLPDFFSLYEKLKVWEYIDYFARAYKLEKLKIPERSRYVLEAVSLWEKKDAFVSALSRGMKQRLGIAKTILHDPELLVMDEPASGLDPLARNELMQAVIGLNKAGKTILISSHILPELSEICNYIGILERGKLVKSGSIDGIIAEDQTKKKIEIILTRRPQKILKILDKTEGVSGLQSFERNVQFEFKGSDQSVVYLHKMLMSKGFPILTFQYKSKDITDIFMEVSRGVEE